MDPSGEIRATVRAGEISLESVEGYVRRYLMHHENARCSTAQLTQYLLALLEESSEARGRGMVMHPFSEAAG